ncbi:hypothetical protein DVK02_14920 [Halobellus sp. Atlit-31R]|nr:hypothetical protein DVK02_14920 [Halobellus sp. Atlit-31R]
MNERVQIFAKGFVSMVAVVVVVVGGLFISIESAKWMWPAVADQPVPTLAPAMLGYCIGLLMMWAYWRLERTRVAWWFEYFWAWIQTWQYNDETRVRPP